MRKIMLERAPNSLGLLVRAGLKRSHNPIPADPSLPDCQLVLDQQVIEPQKLQLFHQITQWPASNDMIHPCIPHILAFPLHMQLMLHNDFPFALIGLVHIENTIEQLRPLDASEVLRLVCQFGEIEKHPKGWMFVIRTEVYCADELVWSAESRNLFRTKSVVSKKNEHIDKLKQDTPVLETTESWSLEEGLGRSYARASGDYNPIHLYRVLAKIMGFKHHIVHGMWSQARCLSALHEQTDEPFICTCQFVKPAFLPGKVSFNVDKGQKAKAFSMTSKAKQADEQDIIHLLGTFKPLKSHSPL